MLNLCFISYPNFYGFLNHKFLMMGFQLGCSIHNEKTNHEELECLSFERLWKATFFSVKFKVWTPWGKYLRDEFEGICKDALFPSINKNPKGCLSAQNTPVWRKNKIFMEGQTEHWWLMLHLDKLLNLSIRFSYSLSDFI